jgi:tetratricopeptide (TPR) repeat protein
VTSDERKAALREGTNLYNAGRAKEAARLLRTISFPPEERQSAAYVAWCCNLGSALAETGELSAATKLFEDAAAIHEHRQEWSDLANVRFNLGNVSRYAGALDQAQIHYEGARAAYEKAEDSRGMLMVLQSLGNLQLMRGDSAGARQRLNQIAAVAPDQTTLDALTQWSLETLRGNVARREGDAARAVECFTHAVALAEQVEDRSYLAEAQKTLGQALLEAGQPSDALAMFEAATELWERLENPQARQAARLRDAVRAMLGSSLPSGEAAPPGNLSVEDSPRNVLPLDAPPPGPQPSIMAAERMTDSKLAAVMKALEAQAGGGVVVRFADDVVFGGMPDAVPWPERIDRRSRSAGGGDARRGNRAAAGRTHGGDEGGACACRRRVRALVRLDGLRLARGDRRSRYQGHRRDLEQPADARG